MAGLHELKSARPRLALYQMGMTVTKTPDPRMADRPPRPKKQRLKACPIKSYVELRLSCTGIGLQVPAMGSKLSSLIALELIPLDLRQRPPQSLVSDKMD
jgi:hypothetical protein